LKFEKVVIGLSLQTDLKKIRLAEECFFLEEPSGNGLQKHLITEIIFAF